MTGLHLLAVITVEELRAPIQDRANLGNVAISKEELRMLRAGSKAERQEPTDGT